MEYLRVARVSDFPEEAIRSVRVFGRLIALLRMKDGTFTAIEGACKHQGADLSKGERNGWIVTCPRHGWQYDLTSGQCLNHDSLPLKRYGVQVEGDEISISFQPLDEE